MSDPQIDLAAIATYVVVATIGGALAPRLAHLLRWPGRARGKALLAYWIWCATFIYTVRFVIAPLFREGAELHEQGAADLRAELGKGAHVRGGQCALHRAVG